MQQTESIKINVYLVVEFNVYCWRKIVKFFWNIIIINVSMSNKYNVKIIIALNLRVALFWSSYKVWIDFYNKNFFWNMLMIKFNYWIIYIFYIILYCFNYFYNMNNLKSGKNIIFINRINSNTCRLIIKWKRKR